MKVILIQNVPGLGEKGDTKEVAEGYARNFLLPKKMAIFGTETATKKAQELKAAALEKENEDLEKLRSVAEKIGGKKFIIKSKAEKEKLFGSIGPKEIREVIAQEGFAVEEGKIVMLEHIKKTGKYEITIQFNPKIKTKIKVIVEAE